MKFTLPYRSLCRPRHAQTSSNLAWAADKRYLLERLPGKHMPVPHEALISWLKYFDVEYLNEECCAKLSLLDPNEPAQFRQAIEIAVLPDFLKMNGISRQSLRQVLQTAVSASDSELAQVFARVEMPFSRSLRSRTAMLELLWAGVFDEALQLVTAADGFAAR